MAFIDNANYYVYSGYKTEAPIVQTAGPGYGPVIANLPQGTVFGRLSSRNPNRSSNPPEGRVINGYVWGYSDKFHKSGYVPLDSIKADPSVLIVGPAGYHKKAGSGPLKRRRERESGQSDNQHYVVKGTKWVYLRSNPKGTAIAYLAPGDRVNGRFRTASGYVKVKITKTKSGTPASYTGWVPGNKLRRRRG